MTSINHLRNIANQADYLRRRADSIEGQHFPDPRDLDLKDLGVVLKYKAGVARRELPVSEFDGQLRQAGLRTADLVNLAGVNGSTVWRWRTGPAENVPQYAKTIVSLVTRIRFLSSQLTIQENTRVHDPR